MMIHCIFFAPFVGIRSLKTRLKKHIIFAHFFQGNEKRGKLYMKTEWVFPFFTRSRPATKKRLYVVSWCASVRVSQGMYYPQLSYSLAIWQTVGIDIGCRKCSNLWETCAGEETGQKAVHRSVKLAMIWYNWRYFLVKKCRIAKPSILLFSFFSRLKNLGTLCCPKIGLNATQKFIIYPWFLIQQYYVIHKVALINLHDIHPVGHQSAIHTTGS